LSGSDKAVRWRVTSHRCVAPACPGVTRSRSRGPVARNSTVSSARTGPRTGWSQKISSDSPVRVGPLTQRVAVPPVTRTSTLAAGWVGAHRLPRGRVPGVAHGGGEVVGRAARRPGPPEEGGAPPGRGPGGRGGTAPGRADRGPGGYPGCGRG